MYYCPLGGDVQKLWIFYSTVQDNGGYAQTRNSTPLTIVMGWAPGMYAGHKGSLEGVQAQSGMKSPKERPCKGQLDDVEDDLKKLRVQNWQCY